MGPRPGAQGAGRRLGPVSKARPALFLPANLRVHENHLCVGPSPTPGAWIGSSSVQPWESHCRTTALRAGGGEWAFPPAPRSSSSLDSAQEKLTSQIKETQKRCRQTLFIFDEAEKLHPGLLEALRPHLERQAPENHRVESPKTIFLFLR